MEPTQPTPNKKVGIVASLIVLFGVIAIVFSGAKKSEDVTTIIPEPVTTDTTAVPVTDPKKSTTSSVYKDGTYTATGAYMSPGGRDQINVSLTLENDVVVSATATPQTDNKTSQKFQALFIADFKQYVVGKNIADVNVGKVSGSSLTTTGFNEAVAKIKLQAKA